MKKTANRNSKLSVTCITAACLIAAIVPACTLSGCSSQSPSGAALVTTAAPETAIPETRENPQTSTSVAQLPTSVASGAATDETGAAAPASSSGASTVFADPANLADGEYAVPITLTGGTGKVTLTSPTKLTVKAGEYILTFVWSSKSYDYMRIDEEKYLPVSAAGEPSEFEIPLSELTDELTVYADTVAMSTPHEIEYLISLDLGSITVGAPDLSVQNSANGASGSAALSSASASSSGSSSAQASSAGGSGVQTKLVHEIPSWFTVSDSMELEYAHEFSVDYDNEGRAYICIGTDQHFLLLPDGVQAPAGVGDDVVIINHPLKSIYAASSSSLDLFDKCGAMDLVRLVSSDYDSWTIQSVRDAMDRGDITYVGKYSEPDFERIAVSGVDFILENNMIYHSPSTLEKLKELGFTVMIDRMSYESHPLGRAEWIRLIGLLTDHTDEADARFDSLKTQFEANIAPEKSDKTVAFFYINSSGAAVIRLPNDYISKMIRLAGGNYVFDHVETDNTTKATMTLEMEAFYTAARDADILIYNNSIDSSMKDIDALLAKSPLLANFKAVKDGNVWCTGENVYQQVSSVADLIEDFHAVIFGDADGKDNLNCLTRLK